MYVSLYRPAVVRANGHLFNSLIDSMFGELAIPTATTGGADVFRARFDVIEKADRYEALIELPGVAKEDIEVEIEGTKVSVKAEAKSEETAADGARPLHTERFARRYARSFELPTEVADEGTQATFENGVLKLVLPKKDVVKARRVAIQ